MIEIVNLTVSSYINNIAESNRGLRVSWTIKDTAEDLSKYEFTVYRSNAPEDGFIAVSSPFFNAFDYIDYDVNLFSRNRIYYYRVRAKNIDTGKEVEIGPESVGNRPDRIVLEIIRRNNLLQRRFVGIPCAILVRKTFGQQCSTCYDHIKSRQRDSECKDCYNTGYTGGFFDQINTFVNFNPDDAESRIVPFGNIQAGDTRCWLSNYPDLSPGDIIVERANQRWRVVNVETTMKFRHLCHQIPTLKEIKSGDIEYEFPVSDPDVIISDLDEAFRWEHTVVAKPTEEGKILSRSVPV